MGGRGGLEEVREKSTRAQTMGPGDFMQTESAQRDTSFLLGLRYSEYTNILGKT